MSEWGLSPSVGGFSLARGVFRRSRMWLMRAIYLTVTNTTSGLRSVVNGECVVIPVSLMNTRGNFTKLRS